MRLVRSKGFHQIVELVDHLTASGSGVNLIEVADGVLQLETAQLIDSEVFLSTVDAVVFAASDSMGAAMGVQHLLSRGLNVVAVSGRITRSPLAMREAQLATGLPVLGIPELSDLETACALLGLDGASLDQPFVGAPAALPGLELTANLEDEYDEGFLAECFVRSQDLSAVSVPEPR